MFGGWRDADGRAPIRLPPPRRRPADGALVIPMMNKAQADIAYGFTTIRAPIPTYYAFWLMNNVLGQYAIGGRLGDSIRERQGMAYYVSSALDANVVEGPLRHPGRRQPGERRSRDRVDRRGADAARARRRHRRRS